MNRDFSTFPDDATGDALFRIHSGGDDLTIPRSMDFTVVFPDEKAAKAFAMLCQEKIGLAAETEQTNCDPMRPWDVRIVANMIPAYGAVTAFENQLERLAAPLAGINDGWGCWVQDGDRPTR